MAPSLFALNVHLDDIHFGDGSAQNRTLLAPPIASGTDGVRSRYASQDDLEEVKGAILGFFRGAGKAVKGLGGGASSSSSPPLQYENGATLDVPLSRWPVGELDGADRDLVTRAHWQTAHPGARCSVPACSAELPQGALNCRCCGRLLCTQHCDRKIRLSASAQPSPRGASCRCCDACYARTAGGTQQAGQTRNVTAGFFHLRKRAVSTALLEGNRIEKRLEKLALAHSSALAASGATPSALLAVQPLRGSLLQQAEQAVVVWEDDASVSNCPFCNRLFGRFSSRRHHCRLCGRVVCAQPQCSTLLSVPLSARVSSSSSSTSTSFSSSEAADIRACVLCEHVVLRQRDRAARARQQPDDLTRLYASVGEHMRQIEETLPTFNALAMKLHHAGDSPGGPPDMARAARIRKQLTMAFNNLDGASKRIAALPARNKSYTRLQQAIRRSVAQYLQLHMFPLTMLPKPERQSPARSQSRASMDSVARPTRTPTPLQMRQQSFGSSSVDDAVSVPSSISTLNIEAPSVPSMMPLTEAQPNININNNSRSSNISRSNSADTTHTVDTQQTTSIINSSSSKKSNGGIAALFSFAKSTASKEDNGNGQEESIRQALLVDPSKQARIDAMAQDEKIASLEVLRDQRQRVLGYISDAQRDRRIDDAVSLQSSLVDLDVELSLLERSL
ncbi:carboxypeptidase Y-deficient [Coemansia sp. IMI 209127]|nr:carboxypeptidase Y-deficient [Coemansia sp. IMI 209127]